MTSTAQIGAQKGRRLHKLSKKRPLLCPHCGSAKSYPMALCEECMRFSLRDDTAVSDFTRAAHGGSE